MITKKVNRYYCEFCKKANCSAFSISRHESACTLNPNRICNVCKMDHGEWSQNEFEQRPISELLVILPDPVPFKFEDPRAISEWYYHDELTAAVNKVLPKLREISGDCPACIMAALRQKGIPVTMVTDFNFKAEMEQIWNDINAEAN